MKKFSLILIVAVAFFMATSTGCSEDPVVTPQKTVDTTNNDTVAAVLNQLSFGPELYEVISSASGTTGQYNVGLKTTTISVSGVTDESEVVEFDIVLSGDSTGTYNVLDNNVTFACGRNEGNRREDFGAAGSDFTVIVNTLGAVGQKINGTFEGNVKNSKTGQSLVISDGKFEVTRLNDQ